MMKTWKRGGTCAVAVALALVPMTGRAGEDEKPAGEPEARRTLVMVQPLSGAVGLVGASVEHAVGSHVTLVGAAQVSASALSYTYGTTQPTQSNNQTQSWGVGVDPGVHYYFTGHAPEGFWVGPHLELSTQRQFSRNQYPVIPTPAGLDPFVTVEGGARSVGYGGSVRVGYTAIVSPGLTVQVGAGLAVQGSRTTTFTPRISTPDDVPLGGGLGLGLSAPPSRTWSVAPRMTVALGWAF